MTRVKREIGSALAAGALALAGLVVALPAQAATCNGKAQEHTGVGYTDSSVGSGSTCAETQVRTYTNVGGGVTITTLGLWGSSSSVSKDSSGSYSGGALRARTPTHNWKEIPVANQVYNWTY